MANDIELNTPPVLATLLDAGYKWEDIKGMLNPEREAALVYCGVGRITFDEFDAAVEAIGYETNIFEVSEWIRAGKMEEMREVVRAIAARTATFAPEQKKSEAVGLMKAYLEGLYSQSHQRLLEVIRAGVDVKKYLAIGLHYNLDHETAMSRALQLANLQTEYISTAYRVGISLDTLCEVADLDIRQIVLYFLVHDSGARHTEIMNVLDILQSGRSQVPNLSRERLNRYLMFRKAGATHIQARELSKYSELHDLFSQGMSSGSRLVSMSILRVSLGLPEMARNMLAELLAGKC